MSERLAEPRGERVVLSSDQLPESLSDYAGIEISEDRAGRQIYWGLRREERLSAEDVEQAFEEDGSSLEDARRASMSLERLREEFEEYRRESEQRIEDFETQLSDLEAENARLRGELDLPEPVESENRFKKGWNKVTGRIGNFVLGRTVAVQNGAYNLRDRQTDRRIIVDEEVADGYPESSRRTGAAVLIGAAAVAATALVTWYLTKNGGDPNGIQEIIDRREIDLNIDIDGDGDIGEGIIDGDDLVTPPEIPTDILADMHTDYHVDAPGFRASGVMLPGELELRPMSIGGKDVLADSMGNTVIGPFDDGLWDRQHNLSVEAKDALRTKGYTLFQGHQGSRYLTIVTNG